MRKVGIMGGTFNPIHIGHLTLAEWARETAALDEVWFIPTGISYSKSQGDILPGEDRFHMTELAVEGNPYFRCLDIEIRRPGYTYSYETLEQLKGEYPETAFYFILGSDCLDSLAGWKCAERIFKACTILAAVRGEADFSSVEQKKTELEKQFSGNIMLIPFPGLCVSSTELRSRIHQGKSVRYLIPDKVLAYIEEKRFYCE